MKTLKAASLFIALSCFICLASYGETVKIVAEDDWYPYSGLQGDTVKGIAVDIAREAFKAEGIDVEFDVMNYDRGMSLVKNGEAVGCFDAPRTQEIEDVYHWHDEPLFTGKSYFYARSDYIGTLTSVKDIGNRTLGLTQGYGYGDAIDMNDEINKVYSKTDEIILKKLIAKRVDFIVLYDRVADYLISNLNVRAEIKPVSLSEATDLYIAFSRKHPLGKKYCDIFSSGMRKIKENGTYEKIFKEWDAKLKGNTL
ncbi:MAG: transporter substrate-binding domain-containing protein [Candidatus Omnitrophota bacterium]